MRSLAFVCALAAIVFTSVGFWTSGVRRLEELRDTRERTRQVVADALARAKKRGAPPSAAELDEARQLAASLRRDADEAEREWWRGAACASDYLVPLAARPPPSSLTETRDRIEQALVALPAELKSLEGVTAARLGLRVPSLVEPFPSDAATMEEQGERAVAARLLASALRAGGRFVVSDAALTHDPDRPLTLRLVFDAGVNDALALHERLLGASDDAPPRALDQFTLTRRDPRDWPTAAFELADPPVHVELALAFDFPAPRAGASR
jgi:hypothetical protein